MKTVFTNAIVVTVDEQFNVIKNGRVFVSDNSIVSVFCEQNGFISKTKGFNEKDFDTAKTINCKGNILMPGLINTHTHAAMTLFRGMADEELFENWWSGKIRPLEENLTDADIKRGAEIAVQEMIQNGITTFFDCYFGYENTILAAQEAGIRVGVAFGALTGQENETDLEKLQKEYDYLKNLKNVYPFVYAHSVYSCDEFQFMDLIGFAKKNNLVLSTHVSETLSEVGKIHAQYGETPVGLLESYGAFEVPCVLAHCVHCDKDDVKILQQNKENITIAHNPASNLKLGSGIAPITSYLKAEIPVSLGTDGAASNNNLDILKEMNLAINLQYGVLNNAQAVSMQDAIKMATVNGAEAFRINNLGQIKAGMLADIIMLDASLPNMQPNNNVVSNIVFSATNKNVIMTVIDGKIVYDAKSLA